ncbi:hypothetical protein H6G76_34905 [Nostoc sp. FACHB-152]|uniref:DUF6745 domain-containing protein n=1 Tax=unclassified Nostoc TaxID=2593658 RepID=UPI0016835AAC|nr:MULTISPECIES: hypothetical protein [unclassified Nostoc]MBD2452202.1 hypothetical protein [Nostoc sp. FACHB-152]MBD2473348.1 hypothetical protein [Nostoc sp. FACHB-145]
MAKNLPSSEKELIISQTKSQWQNISSTPLDLEQATIAIQALYKFAGLAQPEVQFVESPVAAREQIEQESTQSDCMLAQLWEVLREDLWHSLCCSLGTLQNELTHCIRNPLSELWERSFQRIMLDRLTEVLGDFLGDCLLPEWGICWAAMFVAAHQLGVTLAQDKYNLFCNYMQQVGWMFPYEGVAIAIQRPLIRRNSAGEIHGEGIPAIEFSDGCGVYAYRGINLPEKYGQAHPTNWRAEWLLEQRNAELRRVLIQGIGYERIYQQLQAKEYDRWQEYTLLQIESEVDVEPIHLLKMTCPSTGFTHVLRVPPDISSARESIRWVNWGIDPTEFAVQS